MPAAFEQSISINASEAVIWAWLTQVELMKVWMGEPEMGLEIDVDWTVGAVVTMRGFHHAFFTNTGTVLVFEPHARLAYTHLSSLSLLADKPENHVNFEFNLIPQHRVTVLRFKAYGFPTPAIFSHLKFYWESALHALRQNVEAVDVSSDTATTRKEWAERGVPCAGNQSNDD